MRQKMNYLVGIILFMSVFAAYGQTNQKWVSYTTSTVKTYAVPCDVDMSSLSAFDSIYLEAKPPLIRDVFHEIENGWLTIINSYWEQLYYDECYGFIMSKSVTDKWGTKIYSNNENEEIFITSTEDSTGNENFYYDTQQVRNYGIFNNLFVFDTVELKAAAVIGLIPQVYISGSKVIVVEDTIEAGKKMRIEREVDFEHLFVEIRAFEDSVHTYTDRTEYKRYQEWIIPKEKKFISYSELPSGIRYQITETETYLHYGVYQENNVNFSWESSDYSGDECNRFLALHIYIDTAEFCRIYDCGNPYGHANDWFDEFFSLSSQYFPENGLGHPHIILYDTAGEAMKINILSREGDVGFDKDFGRFVVFFTFFSSIVTPCNLMDSIEVNLFEKTGWTFDYTFPEIHIYDYKLPFLEEESNISSSTEETTGNSTSQKDFTQLLKDAALKKELDTETGIQAFEKTQKIKVYPNPAKEQVTLVLPSYMNKEGEVKILNTLGVAVLSQQYAQGGQITLDIQSLPSGFYVIRCTNDKNVVSSYFVKQ